MRPALRTYLAFLLSVLLILTGQSVAASRGMTTAVGQMEICSGTGPVVVYVDAEGQPTNAPHYCPDYALTLLGAVEPVETTLPSPLPSVALTPPPGAHDLVSSPVTGGFARAPPFAV